MSVENLISLFSTQFVPFRGLKGRKKGMLVKYEKNNLHPKTNSIYHIFINYVFIN